MDDLVVRRRCPGFAARHCHGHFPRSLTHDVRNALHNDNPALRATAVRQLQDPGDRQLLLEALNDKDADVRMLAIHGLGGRNAGNVETTQLLVRCFKDDHLGVRQEAAWQLSWCWHDSDQLRILDKAAHDNDPQIRATAELALSFMYSHKEYIMDQMMRR